jgi:hypothetical protein
MGVVLYHGSGATDYEISKYEPLPQTEKTKAAARRLLEARGDHTALQELNKYPFSLLPGSNYFNDDFSVLHSLVGLDLYEEASKTASSANNWGAFARIAKTFSELGTFVRFIVIELDMASVSGTGIVPAPALKITSQIVDRALTDAEKLLATSGATSGVDRIHTALHGYLLQICADAQIIVPTQDPNLTQLYKALRAQHPKFSSSGPRAHDIEKVLNSLSAVVDALNPLRNKASVAHPNANLLAEPEAMLVINAVRTLLHYLEAKTK